MIKKLLCGLMITGLLLTTSCGNNDTQSTDDTSNYKVLNWNYGVTVEVPNDVEYNEEFSYENSCMYTTEEEDGYAIFIDWIYDINLSETDIEPDRWVAGISPIMEEDATEDLAELWYGSAIYLFKCKTDREQTNVQETDTMAAIRYVIYDEDRNVVGEIMDHMIDTTDLSNVVFNYPVNSNYNDHVIDE